MDSPSTVTLAQPKKELSTEKFLIFTRKKQFFRLEEKISYTFSKKFLMLVRRKLNFLTENNFF